MTSGLDDSGPIKKKENCLRVTRHQQGALDIMVMQVVATATWYRGPWHQGVCLPVVQH